MLLCLLAEGRLRGRRVLRVSGAGRLVLVSLFLFKARLPTKSRCVFSVGLAVLLGRCLVTGIAVLTGAAVAILAFAPRHVRLVVRRRLSLRDSRQRLALDIFFLFGTPDLDGEGFA